MEKKLKIVSLFSGIGGFEAGIEKSQICSEFVFSSEIDKFAKVSYTANYGNENLFGDITKIDENEIPDHDLLVAGFPCQAFSIAGKRNGFSDTRGTLFFEVARILKLKQPQYILLENVKNLISHDNGETIKTILNVLNDLNYTVDFTVINSQEAGLPQNRERTYIVGIYNGESTAFTLDYRNKNIALLKSNLNNNQFKSFNFFSTLKFKNDQKYIFNMLENNISEKYYLNTPIVKSFLLNNKTIDSQKSKSKIVKLFDLPKDVWNDQERQRRVYSIYGISPTILARSDSTKIFIDNGKYTQVRKLTPIENLKIQGFEQEFINNIVSTGMSDTQLYKQSGNAVSPPVITGIINHLNAFIKVPSKITPKEKLTFIDLFSGLGGFRIALENLGCQCLMSSDIDPYVRETYKNNFKDYPRGDLSKISSEDIPKHDILCAGFPCQPFSIAGKRLGFDDTRGTLFFEVARIIKEKQPKAVFLENVVGLVNHHGGKTLDTIKTVMNDLGYFFFDDKINAMTHGVPQNRHRWYGVGFRKDLYPNIDFNFPKICELDYSLESILEKDVSNEYEISVSAKNNILKHLEDFKNNPRYNKKKILLANEIRASRCNFRCDGISPCLTAKMGTGGNNVPVLVKDFRKLTETECLRIMGFPNWYKIKKNNMQSYKQIGNSVVVPIIEKIAKEIINVL